MSIQYYVIDVETNGLKTNFHEITEISIIRFKDKVQLSRNIRCHNPLNSSADALKITNKSIADISKGYERREVVDKCNEFFKLDGLTPNHRCIIGHNIISFDKKFLHALWESVGSTFPANLWLDTMALSREYIKINNLEKQKVNLHAACDMLGIKKFADSHNAVVDTRNTYLLYKTLTEVKNIDYLPFIKTFPHGSSDVESEDFD